MTPSTPLRHPQPCANSPRFLQSLRYAPGCRLICPICGADVALAADFPGVVRIPPHWPPGETPADDA